MSNIFCGYEEHSRSKSVIFLNSSLFNDTSATVDYRRLRTIEE